MDGEKEKDEEWRWKMGYLVMLALEMTECTTFVVTLPPSFRRRLGEIIERAMQEEDVRGLVRQRMGEVPRFASPEGRLCWAIHTGKTLHELLGPIRGVNNIGMLIDAAIHDDEAMSFSGLIEAHTFRELQDLLLGWSPTENDLGVEVADPVEPSTRSRLSPAYPFLILRIAKETSTTVRPDPRISSSQPPPLN